MKDHAQLANKTKWLKLTCWRC